MGELQDGLAFVDTHTHVNSHKFDDDRAAVIERAREAGVTRIINMGDTMDSSAACVALTEEYDGVFAAVGIHPEEAYELGEADDERLAAWAKCDRVVAIGEIGLDYYWEQDPEKRALQQRIFIRQLALARDLDLPVCIHDRDAHGDTLSILKKEGKGNRGVLHCYSGSLEMAEELVRMGWYLGVDGPLTYKNAAKLPEIVQKMPLERLLVETDAPYLTPVPHRGGRNEPAYVRHVAEKIAELRGISLEEVARQTTANAETIYAIF